ncbi:MAG: type II toxin-antitoxin system VapC family toxin [Clostridiales Family XIII bacterium]|jgi:PIN domain nuclease of toxin-antitoxin system|nr:type II toxin-antitoxin system VapC family toxin [Clostridiales Family XIII bacterium]
MGRELEESRIGYLLDTHALLWAIYEDADEKLSGKARAAIEAPDHELFLSSASIYEIAYKHRIGKLPGHEHIVFNHAALLKELRIAELPVSMEHAFAAGRLDWERKDPFDRLIAAQAITENLVLLTKDRAFSALPGVRVFW